MKIKSKFNEIEAILVKIDRDGFGNEFYRILYKSGNGVWVCSKHFHDAWEIVV